MQTYVITPSQTDLSRLAHLAAQGQEVLLTENDKPLAKLVPAERSGSYLERVRALRGSAPGIDTTVDRDDDQGMVA